MEFFYGILVGILIALGIFWFLDYLDNRKYKR
jgi:capsular polysaccharide biosynthesis protein